MGLLMISTCLSYLLASALHTYILTYLPIPSQLEGSFDISATAFSETNPSQLA